MIKLCAAVSLAITPWTTFDPINPPKFLILTLLGGVCAIHMFQQHRIPGWSIWLKTTLLLVLVVPCISALATKANLGRDLYGAYGRLFGLATIFCLVLVLSYFASSENFRGREFLEIFQIISVLSISYGLLQFIGKDFAPWENPYNPIVGFFGNPNFMSSFTGISVILLSYWYVNLKQNLSKALVAAIFQILGILLIIKSDSIQGLFVILAGAFSSLLYFIITKRRIFFDTLIIIIFIFASFLIGLAIDQKGPLSVAFSSGTLANRLEYWKTGVRMFLGNWQLGVGPDQFGTWFRYYRPESTIKLLGTEVVTDSPHNSIIEFAANYGILGLIGYLSLTIIVFTKIIKFARRSKEISIEHMLFSGALVGYFAQSLISPNQIGLAIWGWAFMGVVINKTFSITDMNLKIGNKDIARKLKVRPAANLDFNKRILSFILGSIIGLLVAFPLFYQHMLYRNALVSSDAVRIIKVAESWPKQEYMQIQIVEILMQNQYWALAKRLNSELLSDFPDSYLGWQKLYENKETKLEEREMAREELHRLDPLNPNWN